MQNKTAKFLLSLTLSISAFFPIEAAEIFNGRKVSAIHPAGANEGKILTMEETILSKSIRPETAYFSWQSENNLIMIKNSQSFSVDLATGKAVLTESNDNQNSIVPPEAENIKWSNNNSIAYTIGQNLYFSDSENNRKLVAKGDSNISFGQSVSRNEFGISDGIFWSPNNSLIAFYRKDESLVTDFPLIDITTRTGSLKNLKYPMNGMDSEKTDLGIYTIADSSVIYIKVDDFEYDRYLTNISWSPDSRFILIQILDRSQKHLRLNMYRATDGSFVKTLLTEDNDKYVEPLDPIYFLKNSWQFIYRTANRDGYRNLYLCDTTGTVRRLTATNADVRYIGNDGTNVYYTSAEISPVESHLFSISIKKAKGGKASFAEFSKIGTPVRHTFEPGWHNITFSPDYKYFIDSYSSFNLPFKAILKSSDNKFEKVITESYYPLSDYATGEVEIGTVPSADGKYSNWYRLLKPKDFDPAKKYPVILYVYGGPHSQLVKNTWLGNIRLWEMYMAQRGYIVYVQDNRGTENRGLKYEQAIHKQCGQVEMADQMVGIEMLKSLPYVDSTRIGVHGWSYGGFMTISLMTNFPETFKVGVAGGPVIDWKWYEIMYGERYMETEATNADGFIRTSLMKKVNDLKGKLLICQGAVDNTVLWQHSLNFVQECIRQQVQLDYFPYPIAEHNVYGKDRVHLMNNVTLYFDDNL
ncbi:MAG: DPP IV N-terminal domain-containing protein [Candidatus Cryptobacteroides sp.]